MYHAVMVRMDGSDWSRHAIPLALAVARPAKATIRLVSVLDETFIAPIYGVPVAGAGTPADILSPADASPEMWQARRDAQNEALRKFADQLTVSARATRSLAGKGR